MEVVKRRLEGFIDVVDEEALYYIISVKRNEFWRKKYPINDVDVHNIQNCCQWCSNRFETTTFTMQVLQSKMKNVSSNLV